MTARNAARASSELADRSQLALALDSAERHARAELSRSHPSIDRTPYFDDQPELSVEVELAREFLDARDTGGVMWDARARDVAAQIDLNSASPQVFANLLGASTRLVELMTADADAIQVSSTAGFEPSGFVWVGGELVGYGALEPQALTGLARGLASVEGQAEPPCPPKPPQEHPPGTPVIDQRAFAPVEWRNGVADGLPRRFDAPDQLRAAAGLALGGLSEGALAAWEGTGSAFAGVRARREWQRAARLASPVEGGQDCRIALDNARWFAPGTTVQISDGRTTELGVVLALHDTGEVELMAPLVNDYDAYEAEVRALARRPVNVNAARPETLEVLFANLQLAGVNERITRQEARELAALVVRSRPFTGFEDLLTRVLLPAGGIEAAPPQEGGAGGVAADAEAPVIDAYDALAAYENALNANSSKLAYATMPFAFTSREVFDLELCAAVNAESGAERGRGARRQIELLVPQQDLLAVFARQEDFDELLRLDGEAPWWSTGPEATSQWDAGAVPPSRYGANIGSFQGDLFVPGISPDPEDWTEERPPAPVRVFASREDQGWAQLWPARLAEVGALLGKVEHFDHETRDPEGRFLPDEIVALPTDDPMLEWTELDEPLLRCVNLSLWLEPRELAPGVLVDIGTSSLEADRITLAFEEGELVLSVLDAMGDQTETEDFREGLAARYALAPGDGPGLPADTWTHVAIDVRGNRPDQVSLRVDGRTLGVRQTGISRLTSAVTTASTMLELEDGEMFPERGVVRIGREWIEYRKAGPDALDCTFRVDDPVAPYTGGRYARLPFIGDVPDPAYLGLIDGAYAPGTSVELAGYTKPLRSAVSPAVAMLPEPIGPLRVAYVEQVIGGLNQNGDDIVHQASGWNIGPGLDAGSTATALVILPADSPGAGPQSLSEAFHQFGGYAALVQWVMTGNLTDQVTGVSYPPPHMSQKGALIGGVEIIRYSSFDGTQLQIAQRAALPAIDGDAAQHAFVRDWTYIDFTNGKKDWLQYEIFVVPLSIPIGGTADFPVSYPNRSELAQITHEGAEIGLTEWVRYDSVAGGHLVRHASAALEALQDALVIGGVTNADRQPPPPPGGGGPGSGGGPTQKAPAMAAPSASATSSAAALASPSQSQGAPFWDPYLGQEEPAEADAPVSRAAASALHFRGIFGTYGHAHPGGAVVLPTFRVDEGDFQSGWPGRGDSVLLVDMDPEDPGWPSVIHHTWRPVEHSVYAWDELSARAPSASGSPVSVPEDAELLGFDYVGLEEASQVPIAALLEGGEAVAYETRVQPRMLKYPSGERPRLAERLVVGGDLRGSPPPAVVIDELAFGSVGLASGTIGVGTSTELGSAAQGAPLILAQPLADGGERLQVYPGSLRVPSGIYSTTEQLLDGLPPAGLLRLGSEILCYQGYDAASGQLELATDGRGLLGTAVESHVEGALVTYLEDLIVTTLTADVSAASAALPVLDTANFPSEGTLIVGDELVHYTRVRQGALEMPSGSSEPGAMDGEAGGLFRGRFGTQPAAHRQGAPVILFPFRYWDRQAERADGPELAYFGLAVDQPGAFWRSVFWNADEVEGSKLYALQRAVDLGRPAPPWDGEPGRQAGLWLQESGTREDAGIPIGRQADRLEWRVFVRYLPGAFDAADGLSHAWKRTPRLELFAAEYLAPNQVLWRLDQ